MYFWKIDEESIYCLINANEIRDMGYDIKELSGSHDLMGKFLEEIVRNSFQYIKWNADNGIQTYIARALPAGQFLLTISCTFIDVAIDRDLDQIRAMTEAINQKITRERIDAIYGMEGEEKEKAFESLARDLHAICSGEEADGQNRDDPESDLLGDSLADLMNDRHPEDSWDWDHPEVEMARKDGDREKERMKRKGGMESRNREKTEKDDSLSHTGEEKESGKRFRQGARTDSRVYLFRYPSFKSLTAFCAGPGRKFSLPSVLYRSQEDYVLEVTFPGDMKKEEVLYCVMAGEEYGAQVKMDKYDSNYLKEHGTKVIGQDAIRILQSLY